MKIRKKLLRNNADILAIAEAKIDKSILTAQFMIEGFHKPFRLDIANECGGLLVNVSIVIRSYLLSLQLTKFKIPSEIQAIPFEVTMRKEKWFFL